MKVTATPDTNEGILSLNGELTLLQAEQLKTQLAHALEKFVCVRINAEKVTDIDMACLQLICSAHRSAAGRDRHLALMPRRSEVFKAKVLQAGLMYCHNCDRVVESDCLWKGGEL